MEDLHWLVLAIIGAGLSLLPAATQVADAAGRAWAR